MSTVEPVWLRAEAGPARRTSPLTRERIVDEAVALLDRHGAEGLTMRRLAGCLDVTATALYWHVRTRDDVLDLAVDRIFGDVPIPAVTDDWSADARALARAWRGAMLDHPWAPGLVGRPMLGPNVLARTEFLQAALVRGGYRGHGLAVRTRLLANYVVGASLTEATWRRTADPRVRSAAREHVASHADTYPTLTASGHLDDTRWDDDLLFEDGLTTLLGAARSTAAASGTTASATPADRSGPVRASRSGGTTGAGSPPASP